MNWPVYAIVIREAFEALLVVGILSAVAKKAGQWGAFISILAGVATGICMSLVMGYLMLRLPDLVSDEMMLALEVIFPAAAAVMILQAVWWMRKHAREHARSIQIQAERRVSSSQFMSLAAISFLAVSREGVETVLFLSGELLQTPVPAGLVTSILLALLTAIALYLIISRSLQRIGYKWFFAVSSLALIVLSGKLFLDTYYQMSSRGWL